MFNSKKSNSKLDFYRDYGKFPVDIETSWEWIIGSKRVFTLSEKNVLILLNLSDKKLVFHVNYSFVGKIQ